MSHPALISFHVANESWQLAFHIKYHYGRYAGPSAARPVSWLVEGPPWVVKCNLGWGRAGQEGEEGQSISNWVFPCAVGVCKAISVQAAGKGRGEGKRRGKNAWHEFRKLSSSHIWFLYFKVN